MIDKWAYPLVRSLMFRISYLLAKTPIKANYITITGFIFGLLSAYMVTQSFLYTALLFFWINRILDGLDGSLAMIKGASATGGALDIICDFTVYTAISISFITINSANVFTGFLLAIAIQANATAFLTTAIIQAQYKDKFSIQTKGTQKALYYTTGAVEGTETIIFLSLFLLLPSYFPVLGSIFVALCGISAFTRTISLLSFKPDNTVL